MTARRDRRAFFEPAASASNGGSPAIDPNTIALLAFSALAAIGAFILGWLRPPRALAWLAQASFISFTFLLIPVLLIVLWRQHGAAARLAAHDITPHPAIGSALGITTGSGERPLWMFSVDVPPESAIAFYRDERHRPGWQILGDGQLFLLLGRGEERMMIASHAGWRSINLTYRYRVQE